MQCKETQIFTSAKPSLLPFLFLCVQFPLRSALSPEGTTVPPPTTAAVCFSMFRNCFRRSPSQSFTRAIVSPPNFPRPPKPGWPGRFVCVSCQVRALATSAKRSRGTRAPGFLGAIKRLEAHVQSIERVFADRVKKAAATQVGLGQLAPRIPIFYLFWFRCG